jgi:hypothetical protein
VGLKDVDVGFGSIASNAACIRDVRFSSDSDRLDDSTDVGEVPGTAMRAPNNRDASTVPRSADQVIFVPHATTVGLRTTTVFEHGLLARAAATIAS